MKKSLFVVLVILLQSCLIKTQLVSNKQAGYTGKPKKIFIMMVGSAETNDFSEGMLAGMIQKFKEKNIVCDGLVSFELSKETNEDFAKGIDNYKPDASLMINLQETRVMGYGPMGGRFDLTLTDRRTKQQVWTGSLNVSGHLDSKATINKTIDSIIGKLTEDGIVE